MNINLSQEMSFPEVRHCTNGQSPFVSKNIRERFIYLEVTESIGNYFINGFDGDTKEDLIMENNSTALLRV